MILSISLPLVCTTSPEITLIVSHQADERTASDLIGRPFLVAARLFFFRDSLCVRGSGSEISWMKQSTLIHVAYVSSTFTL